MFFHCKKKYWFGVAAAAVLTFFVAVLFFPGFRGAEPPPDTIGGDVVVSGEDFNRGDFAGTEVIRDPVSEERPALSLKSMQPGATGEYVSGQVEADYAFNALGLHWLADVPEGSSVLAEVRFSQDGAAWGDWQQVPIDVDEMPEHFDKTASAGETIGQLVFADEARFFQYRLNLKANDAGQSPSIGRLTASYIDAKGYHESPVSLARVAGRFTAFLEPVKAEAQPGIISRAQWGANEAYMTWTPEYSPVKKMIIHHTVTSNSDPDPAATVRSIYYYHAVSLGWGDIGYNFLIDRQGRIYEGRYGGNGVVGGHALTWNYGSVGISALGNYDTADITPQMYSAFVALLSWESNLNRVHPLGADYHLGTNKPNYLGHRDVGSTACPGGYLYARLPQFRTEAANRYSPVPIDSPFWEKWNALHGAPGAAVNTQYPITGGKAQDFQVGRLIWNQSTGYTSWVYGGILGYYDMLGKWDSFLGLPTSDEYGIGSGRASDFEHGKIYWSPVTASHEVHGGILAKYLGVGGPLAYGFPISDEYDVPGHSGVRESDFQEASIVYRGLDGTFLVRGDVMRCWLQWGGNAGLGLPTSDDYDVPGLPAARVADFVNGKIYWTAKLAANAVWYGPFYDKFISLGGPTGIFGLPANDDYAASGGRAQDLERATMTWSPSLGAKVVYGGIRGKYKLMGGATGYLGLATTDEFDVPGYPGARESDFERGRIFWEPAAGEHSVIGGINMLYGDLGGPGFFGLPLTDEFDIPGVPGGRESDFSRGRIYFHPVYGTHAVYGGILAKYLEMGGPGGFLGVPLSSEQDVAGVAGARENLFQRGRIYWSGDTGGHAVYGGVLGRYLEYGGPTSALGLPVSDEYNYGGGRRSDFQGGYIYWEAATGKAYVFLNTATRVTSDAPFEVRNAGGLLLGSPSAGQVVSVTYNNGSYNVTGPGINYVSDSYIRMSSPGGGIMQVTSYHDIPSWNPSLDDNRFRGAIEVRYSSYTNALWIVNELPLEHYLKGIAETSSGSPLEFLKTMTVAARSYALWHLDRGGKYTSAEIFHLKNSRNGNGDDQVYKGYGLEARFPDLVGAVNITAGQAVTYDGSVAMTSYFSNSDGRTRSAQEAWGVDYWPWLQSVPDPDCNGMTMNGHGVGISGHGALARAGRGDSYTTILGYYYTGISVSPVNTARNIRIAIARVS